MIYKCWRTFEHHFTTDASYMRRYAETKNNGSKEKVCITSLHFMSRFRPCGAKVSSFIIQKFSSCFSLSFNVSVIAVRVFLTNSMIMNFPWLLKSWCLLKCSQTGIALEFLTSCLWLLSLIFCNFDLAIICASALLEYLLDLVTLDYTLLITV